MDVTREEIRTAASRMKAWPQEERNFVTGLPVGEALPIVLATALLDLRPSSPPTRAVHIDLRRRKR